METDLIEEERAMPSKSEESDLSEDPKFIEEILRKYENDKDLVVSSVDCVLGSSKGDNYMSLVKRVIVRGHSPKVNNDFTRQIIIKRQIMSAATRKLFRCDAAFQNEINAYSELVPIFCEFSGNRMPYPKCYFSGFDNKGEEIIALEDLCQSGYKMVNRMEPLQYRQCALVMKELGKLHATSLVMKQLKPDLFKKSKENLKEIVYNSEGADLYSQTLESSLKTALGSMKNQNHDGKLTEAIRILGEDFTGRMFEKMSKIVWKESEIESEWQVICHGDLWVNNLMFYPNQENAESVKLVDLQAMRYTSPVIDILHFIYSSTEIELRTNHLSQLIEDYHRSLIESIKFYAKNNASSIEKAKNCSDYLERVFSLENLNNKIKESCFYGLGNAMWVLPAITFNPDQIPDLSSVSKKDSRGKQSESSITLSETYHKRIRDLASEFYEKGFLNI